MAVYEVKVGQNIWDVALLLYGTIEGAYDLFASNPRLNMVEGIKRGDRLTYHEDFIVNRDIVTYMRDNGIIPANGERGVYFKRPPGNTVALLDISKEDESVSFSVSGQGELIVDWGDNSELEHITLTDKSNVCKHYFDNEVENRQIRWYGDFQFETLDMSMFSGAFYPLRPIVVDKYIQHATDHIPEGLLLFEGTFKVDLQGSVLNTLMPIKEMSLQELDLTQVEFESPGVIDDYLEYIAGNYGDRRNCIVRLPEAPSEKGINAINKILGEVEWNTPEKWEFYINNELYILENGKESEDDIQPGEAGAE